MASLKEVLEFRQTMHQKSMSLIEKKGADYNRDQQQGGDTLFNLRVCEILGITDSTESGILVRLSDKFMRLISLTKPGREAVVKDESVLDTVADVHNYVDYLALEWMRRRMDGRTGERSEEPEAAPERGPVATRTMAGIPGNKLSRLS